MPENENMISIPVNTDDFCFICTCAVSAMIREIETQDYWGEEAHGDKYSKKLWMELLSDLNDRLIQLEPKN